MYVKLVNIQQTFLKVYPLVMRDRDVISTNNQTMFRGDRLTDRPVASAELAQSWQNMQRPQFMVSTEHQK